MKVIPLARRLILAALLCLALCLAGLLTWQFTPPRDPILGTWYLHGISAFSYQFQPDGALIHSGQTGTWKVLPGPVYERLWGPENGIAGRERLPSISRFVSPSQFDPAAFQAALAQGAVEMTPASARVRLYECEFTYTTEDNLFFLVVLEEGELTSFSSNRGFKLHRSRHPIVDWFKKHWPP